MQVTNTLDTCWYSLVLLLPQGRARFGTLVPGVRLTRKELLAMEARFGRDAASAASRRLQTPRPAGQRRGEPAGTAIGREVAQSAHTRRLRRRHDRTNGRPGDIDVSVSRSGAVEALDDADDMAASGAYELPAPQQPPQSVPGDASGSGDTHRRPSKLTYAAAGNGLYQRRASSVASSSRRGSRAESQTASYVAIHAPDAHASVAHAEGTAWSAVDSVNFEGEPPLDEPPPVPMTPRRRHAEELLRSHCRLASLRCVPVYVGRPHSSPTTLALPQRWMC